MKILALEFSSSQRSVAIVEAPAEWAGSETTASIRSASADPVGPMVLSYLAESAPARSDAISLIESALSQAGLEREQIECLAVGLGPGSYTGIRSAIALAQGWQLGAGVRLLGISSVEALAAEVQAEAGYGTVCLVIDAQRHEFYLALYQIDADGCRLVEPLRLASRAEVEARRLAGARVIGPEADQACSEGRVLFPNAAVLGRLAAGRSDFVRGCELVPIYLREVSFVKAPPPRLFLTEPPAKEIAS